MPTLHWIGKEKVINHHLDIPYHTLNKQYTFDNGVQQPAGISESKIIHADNLLALKSLLPDYEGRIKCIYIDPPYNTGNESWVYNDNVSDPRFKKWLGKVVGKEAEDLTRHDKWLCMMYPRLKLLHKLLSDDGAIFISIDDNEQASLKMMMDEIFGKGNFISTIIWEKNDSPKMDSNNFSNKHDFILSYSKSTKNFNIKQLVVSSDEIEHYNKLDKQGRRYYIKPLRAMGGQGETREARPKLYFPMLSPDGTEIYPKRKDGSDGAWRWSKDKIENESDRIEWTKGKNGWSPNYKIFAENNSSRPPETIWYNKEVGSNRTSKSEINSILTETSSFNTPKPTKLIERIAQITSDKNSIILDSFAGSGTTAHSVLNLNKQDGGNRKFILIEMEDYAETITAERVKRVIKGYGERDGTGGGFSFYTLGERVLDDEQNLNPNLSVEKIHNYIWYSETHQPYTQQANAAGYLGKYSNTGYYFYYQPNEVTTLDDGYLMNVTDLCEQYVMYADVCLLSERTMLQHNIIFKKIPRDISKL